MLSGFIGDLERYVGYSPAAFQSGFDGLSHHVSLDGREVLRGYAGPQLRRVFHIPFKLLPNHLEVLL